MRCVTLVKAFASAIVLLASIVFPMAHAQAAVTPKEARAIAKEAYIYANPLVDSYRAMYSWFVDRQSREFKAPWNQIANVPRVFTPDDKAVQGPNSDTPYSFLVANDGTKSCISAVKRITSKTRISRIAKLLFIPALPYAQVFDD